MRLFVGYVCAFEHTTHGGRCGTAADLKQMALMLTRDRDESAVVQQRRDRLRDAGEDRRLESRGRDAVFAPLAQRRRTETCFISYVEPQNFTTGTSMWLFAWLTNAYSK
jgi:hypothetical protein